jgi:hypothetical protein
MNKERAADLYEKLLELARRPGTAAEGENAARFAAELKEKFGLDDPLPFASTPRMDPSWVDFTNAVRAGRSAWQAWSAGTGIFQRPSAGEGVLSNEPTSYSGREDEIDRS